MAQKKPRYRLRLAILYVCSFIVSIAPLLVCFIANWDKYTETPQDTIKLCLGGLLLMLFVFLKVVGKLQMPRRIVLFSVVFCMVYLLQTILDDLLLISFLALLGEILDAIGFQWVIKKTKQDMIVSKTADATTQQVEQVIRQYIGRV